MNAALIIAIVFTGSVILVELACEFRRARSFDGKPVQPKQRRMDDSLVKTKKRPRERNPFLLTGRRRWRTRLIANPFTSRAEFDSPNWMKPCDAKHAGEIASRLCD